MLNKATKLFLSSLVNLCLVQPALAADSIYKRAVFGGFFNTVDQAFGGGKKVNIGSRTFIDGVFTIINYALTFTGVIFFLILGYGGYLWMFARGNQEQIDKAKKITKEVIIGIIVIVLARVITQIILFQVGEAGKF